MIIRSLLVLFTGMNCLRLTRTWGVTLTRRVTAPVSRRMLHSSPVQLASSAHSEGHAIPLVNYASVHDSDRRLHFGDYGIIASQSPVVRTYTEVRDIGKDATGPVIGETVWIRGRVSSVRAKGNACFMVIRSGAFYTIQACHFKEKEDVEQSKAMLKFAAGLPLESIVDIQGVVAKADVKSCSQGNVEIHIRKIFTVSRAPATLPFLLEDAARSEQDIEASQNSDRPFSGVSQVCKQLVHLMRCKFD